MPNEQDERTVVVQISVTGATRVLKAEGDATISQPAIELKVGLVEFLRPDRVVLATHRASVLKLIPERSGATLEMPYQAPSQRSRAYQHRGIKG